MTDPFIAPSARKHGVADDDMLHAYRCAMRSEPDDDGLTMLIGPSGSGALLEIGVVRSEFGWAIVHTMAARPKYLRWWSSMPYSLEYILAHADEFARRFEEHEPDPSKLKDARPLAAIYRAVQARAQAERDIVAAVTEARRAGQPWWLIGSYLGTSGEAARQRYGKLIAA